MEVPAILKKKVGPFPVGVWLLIGGAGIAVVVYMRQRQGGEGRYGNEGYDMYGVPVETDESGYGDVPYTPGVPVYGQPGGGGYAFPPQPVEPLPGVDLPPVTLPPDSASPTPYTGPKTCTT